MVSSRRVLHPQILDTLSMGLLHQQEAPGNVRIYSLECSLPYQKVAKTHSTFASTVVITTIESSTGTTIPHSGTRHGKLNEPYKE